MSARIIEYYFALASPWSYLGNDRLRAVAAANDAAIDPVIVYRDEPFWGQDRLEMLEAALGS